eukprot:Platyproteum_vivax@DN715_c0_g1_i1.p1
MEKIVHPVELTDVIQSRMSIIFTDKNGKFYRCGVFRGPNDTFEHFQRIAIERFLPSGFVWKDWSVSYSRFRRTDILTLISHDMTVWQWDMGKGEPIKEEQVLEPITNLRPQNSTQKINSCIYQDPRLLLYLAENGTLYSNSFVSFLENSKC